MFADALTAQKMLRWVALGIDPGLTGGVAALGYADQDLEIAQVYPMPVKKTAKGKTVDAAALHMLLKQHLIPGRPKLLVAVERVHAMPKQGVTSTFTFGTGYGKVLAAVEILDLPMVEPLPDAWKKLILKGHAKGKDASIAYCRSRYPDVELRPTERSRTDNHGLADALCLAEYALRQRIRQIDEGGQPMNSQHGKKHDPTDDPKRPTGISFHF